MLIRDLLPVFRDVSALHQSFVINTLKGIPNHSFQKQVSPKEFARFSSTKPKQNIVNRLVMLADLTIISKGLFGFDV